MKLFAGKYIGLAVAVLGVGLILFFGTLYIRAVESDKKELQDLKKELQTEDKIKDEVDNSPEHPDAVLKRLQQRDD